MRWGCMCHDSQFLCTEHVCIGKELFPQKRLLSARICLPLKAAVQRKGWPQPEKADPRENDVAIEG